MVSPGALLHQVNYHWRSIDRPFDPTFGKTDIGGLIYWGIGDDRKYACRFELTEAGDVSKITLYCRAYTGTSDAKCGIYSDLNGAPDALLGTSAEVAGITTTFAWRDFNFSPPISLSADFYWLAVIFNYRLVVTYDAGLTNQFAHAADLYADSFEDPFGPAGYEDWEMSIYATYTVPVVAGAKAMIGGLYLVFPA